MKRRKKEYDFTYLGLHADVWEERGNGEDNEPDINAELYTPDGTPLVSEGYFTEAAGRDFFVEAERVFNECVEEDKKAGLL